MERTLIILKPDALQRGIAFELLSRLERRGLRFVALKLMQIDAALARRHYAVHADKFFFNDLVKHISSGPVIVAVLEGPNAIQVVRAMVGATRPHEAQAGTIRGDFALAGLRNLVHASDAPETAAAETALYFALDEIHSFNRGLDQWIYEA